MEQEQKTFGLDRNVFSAGWVSFFMDVSSEMIYPLVPLFLSTVLGVNKSMIGLTEGIQKAFLATITPPEFKATAFGVYATATGLAAFPSSLIAGMLWDRVSPAATFYFGAATAAAAALLFVFFVLLDRTVQQPV